MHKYNLRPGEAIERLRAERPQSMQFHATDWMTDPFFLHDSGVYRRNGMQEQFVYKYYFHVAKMKIRGKMDDEYSTKFNEHWKSANMEDEHSTSLISKDQYSTLLTEKSTRFIMKDHHSTSPTMRDEYSTSVSTMVDECPNIKCCTSSSSSQHSTTSSNCSSLSSLSLCSIASIDDDSETDVESLSEIKLDTHVAVDGEQGILDDQMVIGLNEKNESHCARCRGISCVGPSAVAGMNSWPPHDAVISYLSE